MPIPLWNNLDFRKQQALNMRLHYATTAPADAVAGMVFFDSTAGQVQPKWYDGSTWNAVYKSATTATQNTNALRDASGDITATAFRGVADKAVILNTGRAFSITGKATAAGISFNGSAAVALDVTALSVAVGDITLANGLFIVGDANDKGAAVAKSDIPLSGFGLPSADISFNGNKLTNLADPVGAQDASTKAYVDARIQGLDTKDSCRVGTTEPLPACTYSATTKRLTADAVGALVLDTLSVAADQRILVKNQSDAKQNGIYKVIQPGTASTTFILERSEDFNSTSSTPPKITPNAYVWVEEGAVNDSSGWTVTSKATIVLDTSPINWTRFNGAGGVTSNSITFDKIQKLPGLSILGNGGTTEADSAALTGTAGQVLRVASDGSSLAFGKLNLSDADNSVTGVLPYAYGGTGNAFFQVVGPAQSGKTYTFPNRQSAIPAYVAGTFEGGAATAYDAVHNLSSKDVVVMLYDKDDNMILTDTKNKDADTVTFTFSEAPTAAAGTFRWVAIGV